MKRTLGRALALGGSLLLVSGIMVASAAHSQAADPLLSLNKPTTTSSNESGSLNGPKAVDGNASTRWASAEGSDPQWIRIDLGATAKISQVVLKWEAAYGKAYKIQTSADGTAWSDVFSTTTGNGGTDDLAVNGTGRYVRLHGTARGTSYGYSLFEFEVYGTTGTADTEAPTAPRNLRSTGSTPTTVSLAWDASTDNVGVAHYDVYQHGQLVTSVAGNQLTATASGLTPNTEYDFTVFARDAAPNVSPASNVVAVKTPPAQDDTQPPTAPTNLRSTGVTSNTVSLAWNASTDNVGVVRYDIFRGAEKVGTSTTTTATIGGLAPSTAYTFTAKAFDAVENASAASNPATATTAPPSNGGGTTPGRVTQITTSTDVPWGLEFLPDGSALMAERDTFNITRVTRDGQKTTVGKVPNGSGTGGEGGNLGLELSPTFATDNWVYVYHTTSSDNRVVRMKYTNGSLGAPEVLLNGIPRNRFHNGGRLRFGPDGKLYIATGDAQNSANAQNRNSKGGKILRINADGTIPSDNPTAGNPLWSWGHRNVQGLAFDSRGRLWASELGNSAQDELNLIVKDGNYGWPNCEGSCSDPRFINPKRTWSTSSNSPSGIAIVRDTIFMAALVGQRVYRMTINGDSVSAPTSHFQGTYGRLRTVEPSPDGGLWLTSSNGDKDSTPNNSNTKILHVELTGGTTPGNFALTSSAYNEGGAIPNRYSCAEDGGAGNDISPPLSWTTGNHNARTWAMTFIDTTNGGKHWVIWDIPASVTSLPEALKRAASVNQQFFGPCPRSRHVYEFTLYAINVDTLPGVSQSSTPAQVETAMKANDIASTKLSGTSSAAP
jgi:glucose/arabinose dehydrogenase